MQFASVEVASGVTFTVPSGLVFRCTGSFTVEGTITVVPFAAYGEARRLVSYQATLPQEPGLGADGRPAHSGELNSIVAETTYGGGGGGGGAIVLASMSSVSVSGSLSVVGGNGANGGNDPDEDVSFGAGGAGAGGIIHLLSPTIDETDAHLAYAKGACGGLWDTTAAYASRVGGGGGGGGLSGTGSPGGHIKTGANAEISSFGTSYCYAETGVRNLHVCDPTSLF